jgi:hypothetical protein
MDTGFRPDLKSFPSSVIGKSYPGWPGEKYLDIRSPTVRNLMAARFARARDQGCKAVDPDNTDSYTADTGFGLTEKDALDYFSFLSQTARGLGMAMGLKNNGDLLAKYKPEMLQLFDFVVTEGAMSSKDPNYAFCVTLGKPVYNLEYTDAGAGGCDALTESQITQVCGHSKNLNILTMIKDCNLGPIYRPC